MPESTMPPLVWNIPNDSKGRRIDAPAWPTGWPPPHVGDEVATIDGLSLKVTTVVWYPQGEEGDDGPFVYVVLR